MKKVVILPILLTILCGCNESSSSDTGILEKEKSSPPIRVSQNENEYETKQNPTNTEKEKNIHEVTESSIEKEVAFWRVISDTINIRKSPNIKSQTIAIGKKDQDLEYLHHKFLDPSDNRIWYNIKNNQGAIGWVSSAVVAQSDGQNFNLHEKNTSSAQVIMKSNIRKEPSINSVSISIVEKSSILKILGGTTYDSNDGRIWYHVKTNSGITGWISGKVISILPPTILDISNPDTYVGTWERHMVPEEDDIMNISIILEKGINGYSFYIEDTNNYFGAHASTSGDIVFDKQGRGKAKVHLSSKTGPAGEYEETTETGNIRLLDSGILYDGPIMSGADGYTNYTLFFEIKRDNYDGDL